MIVATIVLVLIAALVTKMVIDVQKFKKKRNKNECELPHTIKYCVTLLSRQLADADIHYEGDISDLGNEVGYALGNVIYNMNEKQITDFIHGLRHGISLTNGTH